jgi:hypothetical protein
MGAPHGWYTLKLLKEMAAAAQGNTVDVATKNLAKLLHADFCMRWRDAKMPILQTKVVCGYMQQWVGIHPHRQCAWICIL